MVGGAEVAGQIAVLEGVLEAVVAEVHREVPALGDVHEHLELLRERHRVEPLAAVGLGADTADDHVPHHHAHNRRGNQQHAVRCQ